MIGWIIFLAIVSILLLVGVVSLWIIKKSQEDAYTAREEEFRRKQDEDQQAIVNLKATLENCRQLSESWHIAFTNLQQERGSADEVLDTRYKTLTDNIQNAELNLANLTNQVSDRTNELEMLAAAYQDTLQKVEELRTQNVAAANTNTELQNEYYRLKDEYSEIVKFLSNAKEQQRSVILNAAKNEDNFFSFELSNKELTLIKTIAEIASLYPELTKDLATIEWKKIWLPKVQDLCNREGLAKKGIYRLVLKSDNNICYVGQAVNIKERWYEHIKKMIGADTKGNEKVYNYRPEDFYWTVLEDNSVSLNDSEKYWIEYYCCKEVGLNKKL